MTFTVTGRSAKGLSLTACESVVLALERAAELLRRGYADVLIADGRGAQFTPDQFTRFYCM
jgi:3-oxoacyl-(acyl-carrier-protein) synthase